MSEPYNMLCDARYGPMLYNRNDMWMGRSFAEYGEFSEREARMICSALRPGMLAIDAGANIGAFTIPMARTVAPTGAVIAFEPQRHVYYVLVANIALNSLDNVFATMGALGNAKGMIDVPQLPPDRPDSSYVGVSLDPNRPKLLGLPTQAVPIMPIDDLNLVRLDFIKADVEGMELDVLRGGADTIARCKPILYLEADKAHQVAPMFEWLDTNGYAVYWDRPPFYNPDNWNHNPENVFLDSDGREVVSTNWLCVHTSREINVTGERVTRETLYDDDTHDMGVAKMGEMPA